MSPGIYYDCSNSVIINRNVTVQAAGAVIDCDYSAGSIALTTASGCAGAMINDLTIIKAENGVLHESSLLQISFRNLTLESCQLGFYLSSAAYATLENHSKITECYEHGIYLSGGSHLTVISSEISHNTAWNSGGGIFVTGNSDIVILDSFITHNNATKNGGGIYADASSTVTVNNTELSFNGQWIHDDEHLRTLGGAGCFGGDPGTILTFNLCFISNNYATDSGGGILGLDDAKIVLTNCTFLRNSAYVGGGIASHAAELRVYGSRFYYNDAMSEGAIEGWHYGTWIYVYDTQFTGNHAYSGSCV